MAANFASFALMGSLLAPFLLRGRIFDVIFVYEPSPITVGFPAVVVRALRKIPLVFWVQDLWPESLTSAGNIRSPWILKPVERMVRFLYRRFDRTLVTLPGLRPFGGSARSSSGPSGVPPPERRTDFPPPGDPL